ncbi:CPBP family intramembrane glutamic endopeptidase [Algoriphagus sp. AK58]|uniref:CPBP family intramembrane glutamic endopeptidase n=1 Tax=Algoriphagus sp. AK58 TaxID=1406877 RepID=UPI00164F199B|nr:CPBP family intramembrane glutamic endopeptidase [Algoriphagus sp. AK58]MBC6367167.1 CPBP family intramembrane metalloprotease domain-containing protein [Algoriphagus sp. AK58]
MEIYETQSEIAKRKNWLLSLVVIVLVTFGALVLLQALAVAFIPFLFKISIEDLMSLINGNYDVPNGRMAMLFVQGIGSGIGFWVAAWIIIRFIEKADLHWDIQNSRVNGKNLGLVLGMTLAGMFFNGLLVYWNAQLDLPDSMSSLENWMKEMETQLMELTKFLTDFQSIPELLTGILVIGVFAGIGEEMFFRGLIQPKMQGYFKSAHWGIWITAIVFSAIHVQFYGFLPRVFLGALFGYMYHYSGSLIYPILAHIFNNSLTVLMVYLANQGHVDFDLESTDAVSYPAGILGLLVLILGFLYFKKVNLTEHGKLDQGI